MTTKNKLTSKDKIKFRTSVEWKEYRNEIIKERGKQCECCGCKSPKISLHHKDLDSNNYKDLTNKSKHVLLCNRCHTTLHHYHTQLFKKDSKCNNPNILTLIKPFFILTKEQLNIFDTCQFCYSNIVKYRSNK